MDRTKVFDAVVKHFEQQHWRRAFDATGSSCLYRAPQRDGTVLKCAIGGLIPDSLYCTAMEGCTVNNLLRSYSPVKEYFEQEYGEISFADWEWLAEIQRAHDQHENVSLYLEPLRPVPGT